VNLHIATAPDSWGVWFPQDPRQTPWSRFLDEVVEAGFDAIELGPYGYLPPEPGVLKRELDQRGLSLTGAFVMSDFGKDGAWDVAKDEVSRICDLLNYFGAGNLVLLSALYTDLVTGAQIGEKELSADDWMRTIDAVHSIGTYAKEHGIHAVFHPHADSPIEHEADIEHFLASTDEDLVSLCLDLGHHAYAGGDAATFLAQHHRRIPYLHFKNVNPKVRAKVAAEQLPFAQAVSLGVMSTLDDGVIDFSQIREVLQDIGFEGYAIVEQDMYPTSPERPLPMARRNRSFLREIGLG
jgi:inosose dehydratase